MSKAAPGTAESSAENTGNTGESRETPETGKTDEAAAPGTGRGRGAARPAARRNRRRRRSRILGWWPLPVCVALGALGGGGYATLTEPRYEATSYVLVSPGPHAEAASALGYAQAYGKVATDAFVLGAAEADAGLPRGALRSRVRAAASPDAPMVRITGSAPRPGRAADYADAVARSLTGAAKKSAKRTGVRLTVVAHAAPSAGPVSPSMPIAVAVGTSAGGLLGALVLLARPQRRRAADGAAVPAPAPGGDDTASAALPEAAGRAAAGLEGAR